MFELPMILMALGAGLGAINSFQQGSAMRAASDYNSRLASYQSDLATQQSAIDETRQRRLGYKSLSSMRAGYGAAGVTIEGSPLDVIENSAAEAEMDALLVRHQGQLRAWGYQAQSELDKFQGKQAQRAGFMNGVSTLLTGGAKMLDKMPLKRAAPSYTTSGYETFGGYNQGGGDFDTGSFA